MHYNQEGKLYPKVKDNAKARLAKRSGKGKIGIKRPENSLKNSIALRRGGKE